MLAIAIASLVVAVAAGVLGFTGLARGFAQFALIVFGIFMALAVLLFVLYFAGA